MALLKASYRMCFVNFRSDLRKLIEAQWRIYASVNYAIIGSDNGLSAVRRHPIIWTNDGLLSIRPRGQIFHWNLIWHSKVFIQENPVTGELPSQRPMTRSFDVFFDLRLNTRLGKQSRRWWFQTPSHSSKRNCNETVLSISNGNTCI